MMINLVVNPSIDIQRWSSKNVVDAPTIKLRALPCVLGAMLTVQLKAQQLDVSRLSELQSLQGAGIEPILARRSIFNVEKTEIMGMWRLLGDS